MERFALRTENGTLLVGTQRGGEKQVGQVPGLVGSGEDSFELRVV